MGLDQARLEGEEYYQVGTAAGLSEWGHNGDECPCLPNTRLGVHGLLGPCTVTCPPAQPIMVNSLWWELPSALWQCSVGPVLAAMQLLQLL